MANQIATSNLGWQNKFSTTLSSGITASDTTIPLTALPTPSEGFLVIEPDSSTAWEVIYYTSKTGSAVVCTSAANGRGVDDSTAQSHSSGATVRMDTTAGMFEVLQNMTAVTPGSAGGIAFASGWTLYPSTTPNTVTALGNRSYSCVFNGTDLTGTLSAGMRLRTTRTVAAPTQCTSLNGTTQYYSKTSPAGMTFTDDFTVSAWVKLSSYAIGSIASRYNGTSGWSFEINASGQVALVGFNGGAANLSYVLSYQSVPLNKWVHIQANLDMSAFTTNTDGGAAGSTIAIDGVNVPSSVTRGGTNPTALIQAGNLEIGSRNAGTQFFPGKIAQVAIFSSKITIATMQGYLSQGLAGTETSLISAYSFNNSINDLNANANNLTANGSAVATATDSPFGGQADGTISSTLDYAIITKTAFSTNTTLTVQVPEGCTIPTSGGVSAISYSTQAVPYLFPKQINKWVIEALYKTALSQTSAVSGTWYNPNSQFIAPIGEWVSQVQVDLQVANSTSSPSIFGTLSTANNSESDTSQTVRAIFTSAVNATDVGYMSRRRPFSVAAQATYFFNIKTDQIGTPTIQVDGGNSMAILSLENAYL